jgi:uroporphyrinogen decarboxylase
LKPVITITAAGFKKYLAAKINPYKGIVFMDHRQRVLTAVNHQEPDFVPTAIWGSAHGITDPLYFSLLKYLHLGEPVAPFRRYMGHTINYYDDRVMEALDVDVRHAEIGFTDLGGPRQGGGSDCWGIRYQASGIYLSAMEHPLEHLTTEDLDHYPFPKVESFLRLDEFVGRAKYLKEKTDYAVVGRAMDSYGLFERCCSLRKTDLFLADLAENEEFANGLIGKVTDTLCHLLEIYLSSAGPYLDIIELPGDDYAALRPIISPRMFDRYFAPGWKRMITMIHQAAPQCKVLFHSDGNMETYLGRLIDLGVDIFHCLEPLQGVDMAKIKTNYGDRLCFWGAIDIKEALQGDEQRVAEEVRERIHLLGKGGGYVLAPANHLQPDVSAQNTVALFKYARQYGQYPLA